jgi:hypothetical protein
MIPAESIRVSRCPAPADHGDVITIEWGVQIPPGGGDPWCGWNSTDHLHHRAMSTLVPWRNYRYSPGTSLEWGFILHETTKLYAPNWVDKPYVYVNWLHPRFLKAGVEPGWHAKLDDHVIPVVEDAHMLGCGSSSVRDGKWHWDVHMCSVDRVECDVL